MRIESMDAATLTANKPADAAIQVREYKAPEPKVKPAVRDIRTISQLTELDKREMPLSEQMVIEAIERANKAIMGANRRFEFSIHEGTKEIMVKVIDSETNELIREIPPEKILNLVAKIWEMVGIIVDERR